jgi:hypothetical protein
MPFTPKDWRDYPDTTTPINAAALEDMETRLSGYTDSSGGGGSGGLGPGSYKSGDLIYTPTVTVSGGAPVASWLYYIWVPLVADITLDRLAIWVRTGAASSTVRLGIYADSAGRPGSRTLDAGTVATDTAGAKLATISQAVTAPGFWAAYQAEGGAPTVDVVNNGLTHGVAYEAKYLGNDGYLNALAEAHTGALPATAAPTDTNSVPPIIYGRVV